MSHQNPPSTEAALTNVNARRFQVVEEGSYTEQALEIYRRDFMSTIGRVGALRMDERCRALATTKLEEAYAWVVQGLTTQAWKEAQDSSTAQSASDRVAKESGPQNERPFPKLAIDPTKAIVTPQGPGPQRNLSRAEEVNQKTGYNED